MKNGTMPPASPPILSVDNDGLETDNQKSIVVIIPDVVKQDVTPTGFADRINAHLVDGIAACVAAGRELISAKSKLGHGEFQRLFERGVLRVDQRTAEMFMKIAEHSVLSKPNNYTVLPAALNTLYQLSRMPARTLQKAIENGKVTSTLSIKEAKALVFMKKVGNAAVEPGDGATQFPSAMAVIPSMHPNPTANPTKALQEFCAENQKRTMEILAAYPNLAGVLQAHLSSLLQKVVAVRQQKTNQPQYEK